MKRFCLSPIEEKLCQALAETSREELTGSALEKFLENCPEEAIEMALANDVAAILGHSEDGANACGKSPLGREHRQTRERITLFLAELDSVATTLGKNNIPLVALKNTGIARGLYRCPGCNPMGDIDLLVRRRDFLKTHELLAAAGYKLSFRSHLERNDIRECERTGGAEYQKLLEDGENFWLELQWRPVAGRWIRPDQEPDPEALVERSVPIEGTSVRLLNPEDNLLQVCLHTAKHSYVREPGFRLHLDVLRILAATDIDWQLFADKVKFHRVKTPVYFSLLIPYQLLGAAVPEAILQELRPPAWKENFLFAAIQRAGLFNPKERKFTRVEYILFNVLLYDDLPGLLRGVFPSPQWMKNRYNFSSDFLLPFFYVLRLINLIFRRLKT